MMMGGAPKLQALQTKSDSRNFTQKEYLWN
jgi:hypothetical protein